MQKFDWALKLADFKTTDDENAVSKLRYEEHNVYRFVQNADTVTLAQGDIAFHKLSDGADMLKKVYQCLTANLGVMAGVVIATSGLTTLTYGYVQIAGSNDSISVSGATTGGTAIAAGDYLKGVNTANYAVRDAATQPANNRNVQVITAVGTTTTPAAALIRGYINCR